MKECDVGWGGWVIGRVVGVMGDFGRKLEEVVYIRK